MIAISYMPRVFAALVLAVFSLGDKPAVIRVIVAIVVNPIYLKAGAVSVGDCPIVECLIVQPFIAEADPAPAIVPVALGVRVSAPPSHSAPDPVNLALAGQVVRRVPGDTGLRFVFSRKAPAAFGVTGNNHVGPAFELCAAIAP